MLLGPSMENDIKWNALSTNGWTQRNTQKNDAQINEYSTDYWTPICVQVCMLDAVHPAAYFHLIIFALPYGNANREWVNNVNATKLGRYCNKLKKKITNWDSHLYVASVFEKIVNDKWNTAAGW